MGLARSANGLSTLGPISFRVGLKLRAGFISSILYINFGHPVLRPSVNQTDTCMPVELPVIDYGNIRCAIVLPLIPCTNGCEKAEGIGC